MSKLPEPAVPQLTSPDVYEVPALVDSREGKSIFNMSSPAVREAMLKLPPRYLEMSEAELKALAKPTQLDWSIRVSFWREFEKACQFNRNAIRCQDVFGGICSEHYWYGKLLKNPKKVAWLTRPIQTYAKHIESILVQGLRRLEELIQMDVSDGKGGLDPRKGALLLEAVREVANRSKGMAVQKTENKTLRVSARAPTPAAAQEPSLEELRKRYQELESQDAKPKLAAVAEGARGPAHAPVGEVVEGTVQEDEREVVIVGVVRP